ncbi:hypothetical protein [Bacillus benzoevorans]|uniref:Uncharacterized protein n=1 Tax=Bacillus benzoevorans TaxID=1456 RepID=A0A7X0LUZ0_9BACI|nr:hypothetical protein [Bacillus benzoevorans]MBB6444042.1 hypothetical protein [Bacillus benzoevorans]
MRETTAKSIPVFLIRVMIIHTLTYIVAGILASSLLDYRSVFELPIIGDYMVPYGEESVVWGPYIQPARGLIIGLVLLPFRRFLEKTGYGWFYIWMIMAGIGIVATPSAAPGSIEGIIYTKLPLWFHFFGLTEVLLQTLVFSIFVHMYLRYPTGIIKVLPPIFGIGLESFAGACFAFIGYALISILFAFINQVPITAEANMSLKVQGLFIAPFIANFLIIIFFKNMRFTREVHPIFTFLIIWLVNTISVAVYQQFILEGADLLYALAAPILPALIIVLIAAPRRIRGINRNIHF